VLLADRGYDADSIRADIEERGGTPSPNISSMAIPARVVMWCLVTWPGAGLLGHTAHN
jgi:hypothetical protein